MDKLLTPQQEKFRIKIPQYIYSKNKGFVYVVKVGNYLKIGSTRTPKHRLNFYKSFPPFKYELLLSKEVYDRMFYERALQDHFLEFQERGEWFDVSVVGEDIYRVVGLGFDNIDLQVKEILKNNE